MVFYAISNRLDRNSMSSNGSVVHTLKITHRLGFFMQPVCCLSLYLPVRALSRCSFCWWSCISRPGGAPTVSFTFLRRVVAVVIIAVISADLLRELRRSVSRMFVEFCSGQTTSSSQTGTLLCRTTPRFRAALHRLSIPILRATGFWFVLLLLSCWKLRWLLLLLQL